MSMTFGRHGWSKFTPWYRLHSAGLSCWCSNQAFNQCSKRYITKSCLQNIVDSFGLFFFISSYIVFWSSIIWFIYKHYYQKLSRNKLCCLYMSSLTIKPCYSLCCLLSMQCQDYSNTKCHLYIYNQSSHTIIYTVSILYTRPSYTSYQCGLLSIQIYTNCLLSSIQIQSKSYNIGQYQ